jgi:uncharacterized protein (TIGR03067 family)
MVPARMATALLVAVVVVGQGSAQNANPENPLSAFVGHWKTVSLTKAGEPAPPEYIKNDRTVIQGDGSYVQKRDDKEVEKGRIQVDATKKPHTIDFNVTFARYTGTQFGIYRFEDNGNTLVICLQMVGDMGRPESFDTSPGMYTALFKLTKETEPDAQANTKPADPPKKK